MSYCRITITRGFVSISTGMVAYVAAEPTLFIAAPDFVCRAKDSSMIGSNVQTKS